MILKEWIVFRSIFARRSIRLFDAERAVEKTKIVKLLKAAMAAPSACNIQPWDFIVVTDRDRIAGIHEAIRQYGEYETNTVIIICGNSTHIPWGGNGELDCAMAMENMMIAAPALGLGTVCIGGFDRNAIHRLFALSDSVQPVGMLYVGYPKERKKGRTRYTEDAVHWNAYDTSKHVQARQGNILVYGKESSV